MKHLLHSIRAVVMIVAMFAFMIMVSTAMTQIPATVGSATAGDVFVVSVVPTVTLMGTVIITPLPLEALSTPAGTSIPETYRLCATTTGAVVYTTSGIVNAITPYIEINTINTELIANATTVRGITTELMTKPAPTNRSSPDATVNYTVEGYRPAANFGHFIS